MIDERADTTTVGPYVTDVGPRKREALGLVLVYPALPDAAPNVWTLGAETTVGRSGTCDIQLNDGAVSRLHAHFAVRGECVTVRDAGSRFGTYVDSRQIGSSATVVAPGSLVRFGQSILLVVEAPDRYATRPHRLSAKYIGLSHDVLAGPDTWSAWQLAMVTAPQEHPVLVIGESGTGKEVIARLLHLSRSPPAKWVAVNLAAIPNGLFEAELFGYGRGAFTGASHAAAGAFREANGGTLFLDEVGELKPELQVKLLRALETKTVRPLGANGDVTVDVRVVAATSRDLEAAVEAGTFRADLYYRLSGVVIRLKPLRERRDEILSVARAVLARDSKTPEMAAAAAEELLRRHWPGNSRELYHVMVRAALAMKASGASTLQLEHLPEAVMLSQTAPPPPPALTISSLRQALRESGSNATKAAALLGVSRATVYNFCARNKVALSALRAEVGKGDGASAG